MFPLVCFYCLFFAFFCVFSAFFSFHFFVYLGTSYIINKLYTRSAAVCSVLLCLLRCPRPLTEATTK